MFSSDCSAEFFEKHAYEAAASLYCYFMSYTRTSFVGVKLDASSDFAKLIQPSKAQPIIGISTTHFFSLLKVVVMRVQVFIIVTTQLNVSLYGT